MDTNDLIAALEEQGYTVVKDRDPPDEQLRLLWRSLIADLRMAEDIAQGGARLRVNHPAYMSPNADMIALLRAGVVGRIDAILSTAIVVREPREEGAKHAAE